MKNISECDVVVIGAGAAGLAATAELIKTKICYLCQAMDRIGGRCFTDNKIFDQPLMLVLIASIVTQIIRLHITGFLRKMNLRFIKLMKKLQFMKVTKNQTEKSYLIL